jgi:1,4-alpha-glucan branching enzyme
VVGLVASVVNGRSTAVIKKKLQQDGSAVITFSLPDEGQPVSVVADVNGWDPHLHPMKKRSNGTRSVTITVAAGSPIRFRYLDAQGRFFDDPDGDLIEPNGYGDTHTVVLV